MKLNLTTYDIKHYFKKNQKIYFFLLAFFILGLVVGIFVAVSSDSYTSLLTSSDKIFYDYVNGNVSYSLETGKLILNSFLFEIVIFLLCLNFYSGILSYFLISYQSALMILSVVATISEFGFSGIMLSLFLSLPVNLVLMCNNLIFAGICLSRSYSATKNKMFSYGFNDKNFWMAIGISVLFLIVFSCLINLLFLLVLKSRIFIMF